jgi:hypothetical protein
MNQLDQQIAEHISRLRELAKEAEDFAIRLQQSASQLEHDNREKTDATPHVQAG